MLGLLLASIAAGPGLPAAANEGSLPGSPVDVLDASGPVPAAAFPLACPWAGSGPAGSPGLGAEAFRDPSSSPGLEVPASSRRLSLCSGSPAGTDGPPGGFGPDAAAPGAWAAPDPREPLRGVRNASAPYGKKLRRGVLIITGTEIASGLVLALMPNEDTNWDDEPLSHAGENFRRAWTTLPAWDRDDFFHDWIGHPYAGAFYYNMMRSQGGTVAQSFAFSCLQSFLWEYVLEAWAEQPSAQDLVSTSLIGSALGELFHRWSVAILRKGRLNLGQKALVFFLNPSYVINNGFRPPG